MSSSHHIQINHDAKKIEKSKLDNGRFLFYFSYPIILGKNKYTLATITTSYLPDRSYQSLKTTCKAFAGVPQLTYKDAHYRNVWGKKAYHGIYDMHTEPRWGETLNVYTELAVTVHSNNRSEEFRYYQGYDYPVIQYRGGWPEYRIPENATSFCCWPTKPYLYRIQRSIHDPVKYVVTRDFYSLTSSDTGDYDDCCRHYACSTIQAPIRLISSCSFCIVCPVGGRSWLTDCSACCTAPNTSEHFCRDDFNNYCCIPWCKTNIQTIPCVFAYSCCSLRDCFNYAQFRVMDVCRDKTVKLSIPLTVSPEQARSVFKDTFKTESSQSTDHKSHSFFSNATAKSNNAESLVTIKPKEMSMQKL